MFTQAFRFLCSRGLGALLLAPFSISLCWADTTDVFPRLLELRTTREVASQWQSKWNIIRGDSVRLRDEGAEVVQLGVAVGDHAQAALLENLAASGVLAIKLNVTLEEPSSSYHRRVQSRGINGEDLDMKLECYGTVEEVYRSMEELVEQYPGFVSVQNIGKSYLQLTGEGGNDIRALVLSAPSDVVEKAPMVIIGGQHGRELPPPETLMRWAQHLLQSYDNSADIQWVLDRTTIHIIPIVNPDGREIVQDNLSWHYRKNAHGYGCKNGVRVDLDGVDLNRNYPVFWGLDSGSTADVCGEDYRGPAALSEPESSAVFNYVRGVFSSTSFNRGNDSPTQPCPTETSGLFLDIHSSLDGEFAYFPWAIADIPTPNHESLLTFAAKLAHPGNYTLWGPGQDGLLYFVSGDVTDSVYGTHCVASLGLEIGPGGFYADCQSLKDVIIPVAFESLLYAAKVASAPYKLPLGPDILSLTSRRHGESVEWMVEVSDEALIVPHAVFGSANKSQPVASVRVYIDLHPLDELATGISMEAHDKAFDSVHEIATLTMDVSGWESGRHALFFQGTDTMGNDGPVSAVFFEIEKASGKCPLSSMAALSLALSLIIYLS